MNRAATFEARHWRAFFIYTTGEDAGAPMAPISGTFMSRTRNVLVRANHPFLKYWKWPALAIC